MNRDQYLAKREWFVEKHRKSASASASRTGEPAVCRLGLDDCHCNGAECVCAMACQRFLLKFTAAVPGT